jgi:glycosyltransferase involved in cell wall biosynthesis
MRQRIESTVIILLLLFMCCLWRENVKMTNAIHTLTSGNMILENESSLPSKRAETGAMYSSRRDSNQSGSNLTSPTLGATLAHLSRPLQSPQPTNNSAASEVKGTNRAKPKLVIAGPVRNAQRWLRLLQRTIKDQIMPHFEVVKIILFENDSTDQTKHMLHRWTVSEWKDVLHVITESNLDAAMIREQRLAYARTKIWSAIQNLTDQSFDFVLKMDMDDVNREIANIDQCFHLPTNWGVCCANNLDFYYDLWALRTFDDWVDVDVFYEDDNITNYRHKHISAEENPIHVRSCFGGAAIYRYAPLRDVSNLSTSYEGINANGGKTCEHVPFHENIIRQLPNYAFFIQPKFINTGPTTFKPKVRARLHREANASRNEPKLRLWYSRFDPPR